MFCGSCLEKNIENPVDDCACSLKFNEQGTQDSSCACLNIPRSMNFYISQLSLQLVKMCVFSPRKEEHPSIALVLGFHTADTQSQQWVYISVYSFRVTAIAHPLTEKRTRNSP
jgi:hypothetical protein